MEKTVKIDGMKCDGCVQAVTEKFSGIDGVTNVAVHLADQTAIVTADREVSQDELNTTLADTKSHPILKIETREKVYYYTARDGQETTKIYQEIKAKLP